MLNMDLGNIRNLMLKTQASILESGFLTKPNDDLNHVSVTVSLLILNYVLPGWCLLDFTLPTPPPPLPSPSSPSLPSTSVFDFISSCFDVLGSLRGCSKANIGWSTDRKSPLCLVVCVWMNVRSFVLQTVGLGFVLNVLYCRWRGWRRRWWGFGFSLKS